MEKKKNVSSFRLNYGNAANHNIYADKLDT